MLQIVIEQGKRNFKKLRKMRKLSESDLSKLKVLMGRFCASN